MSKRLVKHLLFPKSIIVQAVYFKLRFSLSYRDSEELMEIRGVKVDHKTIQRWVFKFTPIIELEFRKRLVIVGEWKKKKKKKKKK
jgi:putative transposase